ncbi:MULTISPECIES: hypothetical protein [unclassified Phycicoccus]|uniref:hypothetical protein n=1 Tax=unclassified Phycicoccus TaxID=2637926 RepID=UPI0007026906|nr:MULTISPECIES: hypothetical protein [unclassified Phycicoccus]KQU68627.1 hypothetical protein ASC58_07915 [Phycicoccus sp. Root101]KQZ88119.1 hypothetical protein ASD62_01070 [Phycicoccus sp. Root563]
MTVRSHRRNVAHHHPMVFRATTGSWVWMCSCGGASCRTGHEVVSWRQALVDALGHSERLAA